MSLCDTLYTEWISKYQKLVFLAALCSLGIELQGSTIKYIKWAAAYRYSLDLGAVKIEI